MLPREAVDWCKEHEKQLKDDVRKNFEERGMSIMRKYLMAGPGSSPPEGFPAQTAYYLGYRLVESCLEKMSLEKFCSLEIDDIIKTSRYFQ